MEIQLSTTPVSIDYFKIKKAALLLHAINHTLRKQIIQLLQIHHALNVTEIHTYLRIDQTIASRHLAILRKARIVTTLQKGKYTYYHISTTKIEQICSGVDTLLR